MSSICERRCPQSLRHSPSCPTEMDRIFSTYGGRTEADTWRIQTNMADQFSQVFEHWDSSCTDPWTAEISLLKKTAFRRVSVGKAAGMDGIPPELCRHKACDLARLSYSIMLKSCLFGQEAIAHKGGRLAIAWKHKGDPAECSSHRSFLVSSHLGKLYIERYARNTMDCTPISCSHSSWVDAHTCQLEYRFTCHVPFWDGNTDWNALHQLSSWILQKRFLVL